MPYDCRESEDDFGENKRPKHLNPTFMLNEPVSPEAASPRATTPEPCPNPHCKDGWVGNVGCSICKRAVSPSRDSGARCSDALGGLVEAVVQEVSTHHIRGPNFGRVDRARAALESHIASLERDAARMREALVAIAKEPRPFERPYGEEPEAFIRHLRDKARAALTPSGEPTTKGDSK